MTYEEKYYRFLLRTGASVEALNEALWNMWKARAAISEKLKESA